MFSLLSSLFIRNGQNSDQNGNRITQHKVTDNHYLQGESEEIHYQIKVDVI